LKPALIANEESLHIVIARTIYRWCYAFGVDLRKFLAAVRYFPRVMSEYLTARKQAKTLQCAVPFSFSWPCLDDRDQPGGTATGHYFHQDLLVAKRILARAPVKHVDVGSRIDGFIAHLACFRDVDVLDIRPVGARVPRVTFRQWNIVDPPNDPSELCDSLSCLHAIEHFGLGRYGDAVDLNAHVKAFVNLHKMLTLGGMLYLSVPIGRPRIEFNGGRVLSVETVLAWCRNRFALVSFSYVDDVGDLHESVDLNERIIKETSVMRYGCGIFELRKTA
jgi:hypothetical protein